jgi:transposase-like protein
MHEALVGLVEVAGSGGEVKLSEIVELVIEAGRVASLREKGELVQAFVDEITAYELGRERGEPVRASQVDRVSTWCCSRCGSPQAADFRYSGTYRRRVVFAEGSETLRIPRIRCRCGGSVPPDFGGLLPKRKRHWHDLDLAVIEQYGEGLSYRAIQRGFRRRTVFVGLGGLPAKLAACRDVGLHARPQAGAWWALQADGAYWRVGGQLRAILHVTEVLPRAELRPVGRHPLQHETGQVVGSVTATQESTGEWMVPFQELVRRGWVTEAGEVFLTSDGHGGLVGAALEVFGFPRLQRCTWHIGHRAREYAPPGQEQALENAVHWVFNAHDPGEAAERFGTFRRKWEAIAPEAVASVARKLPDAVNHWVATDCPVRPKTAAVAERHNLEYKRRLRAAHGLERNDNFAALVRLTDLKHNCQRQPGADWLHHVAADLLAHRVRLHHTTTPPPLPPRPTATAYTTTGT